VYRNLIVAWLPLAIAVCAGFEPGPTPSRATPVLAVGAAAVLLTCALAVDTRVSLQRDSWRDVARLLARRPGRRVVVGDSTVLLLYAPQARRLPAAGSRVDEVDVVGRDVSSAPPQGLPRGFQFSTSTVAGNLRVVRFVSRRPLLVRRAVAGPGSPLLLAGSDPDGFRESRRLSSGALANAGTGKLRWR
jgi:hypothetical protein